MIGRRLLALVLVIVAGCAQPVSVPRDSFYRLGDVGNVTPAARSLDATVVVTRFLADGVLSERPVLYTLANSSRVLKQYSYHLWAESPSRMLQDAAVEYLRRARIATAVVTPEFRAAADYEIRGKIKRLEQIRGASPRAAVSLELGLYRVRDDRLLLLKTYDQEVALARDSVDEATTAMGEAVLAVFERFKNDIASP